MVTGEQARLEKNREDGQHADRIARISGHVLRVLGQPTNLYKVQIRPLWQNHFRVNVLIGPDVISARCAHSFFLEADGEGNILTSTPKIVRLY